MYFDQQTGALHAIGKVDLDQQMAGRALVCWLKYTTNSGLHIEGHNQTVGFPDALCLLQIGDGACMH